jgi:ATPase subunit of ABC transporter with duplicated ATPase domains
LSLVQVNDVGISFAGFNLFSGISFNIDLDSRIGLIGRNGCGKTTLLKVIKQEIEPSFGTLNFASTTKIAYLKQVNTLELSSTLYESVLDSRKDFIRKQKRLQKVREKLSLDHSEETEGYSGSDENKKKKKKRLSHKKSPNIYCLIVICSYTKNTIVVIKKTYHFLMITAIFFVR